MIDTYTLCDLNTWARKQHYSFYREFDQPYFNICCELDASTLYKYCRDRDLSFLNSYLYLTMSAANEVENFRFRMVEDEVRIYQQTAISVTQLAEDQTIRFSDIPYSSNFEDFSQKSLQAKKHATSRPFMSDTFTETQAILNTIYMSVIPWISFTSFSHATHGGGNNGIPRIVIGKMKKDDYKMPLSLDVHHALVDGLHVGQFVQDIQSRFDQPERWL